MRTNRLMLLPISLCFAFHGCGPRIDDEELGTILYELPDVPGADERVIVEPWPEAGDQQAGKPFAPADHAEATAAGNATHGADDRLNPPPVEEPRERQ